jgi:hypothetical protein
MCPDTTVGREVYDDDVIPNIVVCPIYTNTNAIGDTNVTKAERDSPCRRSPRAAETRGNPCKVCMQKHADPKTRKWPMAKL